jgi:hypothetical protein
MTINVNFASRSQVSALRNLLRTQLDSDSTGQLAGWEKDTLKGQLGKMVAADSPANAQTAFQEYESLRNTLLGNEFTVTTVVQKSDVLAPDTTKNSLQTQITQRTALVEYLSKFGGANGTAYLSPNEATTLRGYLARAQDLLKQYGKTDAVAGATTGLTVQEAAEVQTALNGPAAPLNGVSLMQRVLNYA